MEVIHIAPPQWTPVGIFSPWNTALTPPALVCQPPTPPLWLFIQRTRLENAVSLSPPRYSCCFQLISNNYQGVAFLTELTATRGLWEELKLKLVNIPGRWEIHRYYIHGVSHKKVPETPSSLCLHEWIIVIGLDSSKQSELSVAGNFFLRSSVLYIYFFY